MAAPARDRALWAAAFYAGLRRGELRALRWADLDLTAGRLRVERSWGREPEAGEPKSSAGRRSVPIVAALRPYLETHRARAADTSADTLVFATATGRPFDGPTIAERAAKTWAAAGLAPFTLHEARHTFASVCIAAGVNAKAIQVFMGHSSVATTYDLYGHLMRGSEDEATELIDRFLAGEPVGTAVGTADTAASGFERLTAAIEARSPEPVSAPKTGN